MEVGATGIALVVAVLVTWMIFVLDLNGLLIVAGVILVASVLVSPVVGVYALLVSVPIEGVILIGEEVTLTRVLGMLVAGAWILHKLLWRESWESVLATRFLIPTAVLVGLALISSVWASYPVPLVQVLTLLSLLAFALMLVDIISSWERMEFALRALIVGGLIAAGIMLYQYFGLGFNRVGEDVGVGINHVATALVVLIPLAFYVYRVAPSLLWRLVALLYIALGPWVIVLTMSRAAWIVLTFVVVWEGVVQLRSSRIGLAGAILASVLALGILLPLIPLELLALRGSTLLPHVAGSFGLGGQISERGFHWFAAVQMFLDHPLVGVGYGNYDFHFRDEYQFNFVMSGTYGARSPHSSLLGLLANLGMFGGGVWIWLNLVGVLSVSSARRLWRSRSENFRAAHLVHAVRMAFFVYVAYGIVTVTERQKMFWAALAFTEVLWRLAVREDIEGGTLRPVAPQEVTAEITG